MTTFLLFRVAIITHYHHRHHESTDVSTRLSHDESEESKECRQHENKGNEEESSTCCCQDIGFYGTIDCLHHSVRKHHDSSEGIGNSLPTKRLTADADDCRVVAEQ